MAGHIVGLVLPDANPSFYQYAGWMFSAGSSMKSYARLGEQCSSVAKVYVAVGRETGFEHCGSVDVYVAMGREAGSL